MRLIDADYLLKASRRGKVLYFDDTTTIETEPVRHGEKHFLLHQTSAPTMDRKEIW